MVHVALSVRGGKFAVGQEAARGFGGGFERVEVVAGAEGRARLLLARADGARKLLERGADGAWSLVDAPPPAPAPAEVLAASHAVTAAAEPTPLPEGIPAGAVVVRGDLNGDGLEDVLAWRRDEAWRCGRDVLAWLAYRDGAPDPDGDGLDAAAEARAGSDPLDADTDADGLLDGWEVLGEGCLDLPALGASPVHKDCFVYVQRQEGTDGAACRGEMERVARYWAELPCTNPDGKPGIALHPLWLPVLPRGDGRPWWELGAAMIPPPARGLAHYMIAYNGGGGQSGELADAGGFGAHAFYATFLHEFGHQVGLTHAGGPLPAGCPTYTSLMNYDYSYGYNEDGAAIHYSDGRFADLVLNETQLAERVPRPLDQLSFLAKAPHRFRLRADGEATWVDWNRNGVEDAAPVRADITDVYGVDGGFRHVVGETIAGPALAGHGGDVLLFATQHDGRVAWRRCLGEGQWSEPVALALQPSGDLAAASAGGDLFLFAPAGGSVVALRAPDAAGLAAAPALVLPDSAACQASAVILGGRAHVLLWKEVEAPLRWSAWDGAGFGPPVELPGLRADAPAGAAEDPSTGELVVGSSFTEGERRGWRLSRFRAQGGGWQACGSEVVGGPGSGWYGNSRPVLLFEPETLVDGRPRLHFIAAGVHAPSACFYEAITIGDRAQAEGWRLRRYYDEWTTTKSPVAACWRAGDLMLAFRWHGDVHGDEDDRLLVSHRGLGIAAADMRDFDDIRAIAELGLARSLPWRDPAAR